MKTNTNIELLHIDNLKTIQKQIFDSLDVLENTRTAYESNISFITYRRTASTITRIWIINVF